MNAKHVQQFAADYAEVQAKLQQLQAEFKNLKLHRDESQQKKCDEEAELRELDGDMHTLQSTIEAIHKQEERNDAVFEKNKRAYNALVDEVKIFDAKHLELRRSNNNASEMLATSEAKIRSKMEKRDALKSQLEKRINDVVYLPVVDKDRMLTFQKEIQQFTDQMPAINAKLARDDAKIKAQQMEKEALSRSLNGVTESKAKAQQECEVLQRKHGDLQKQLANMEAEQKNLSMYPEQKRALQKIKDGLVRETAALKAELRNLKPGPQAIAPKKSFRVKRNASPKPSPKKTPSTPMPTRTASTATVTLPEMDEDLVLFAREFLK